MHATAAEVRACATPLAADDLHVWASRLDARSMDDADWSLYLPPEDLRRAARFAFAEDAARFCASRALLRTVLANYVRAEPRDVALRYSERGKPFLRDDEALRFNNSHSGRMTLIGVTLQRDIGVDVEKISADVDVETLAGQFFSSAEVAAIARLPTGDRLKVFFDCWTRKEAFLKATGEGLMRPLDSFDVSVNPGDTVRLLATRPDPQEAKGWKYLVPAIGAGYAAAIIVRSGSAALRMVSFDVS